MKFTLTHTTTVIQRNGQDILRGIFLGFAKTSSIFGDMLEIPDIFWGNLSGQGFFWGGGKGVGYRADAGAQPICSRKKSEYPLPR